MMPEEHSKFGYSAVSTFEQCPFRFKCQYIDGLQALPTDDPTNALVIGTALHKAIETDIDTAIAEYFASYPIITDAHIDEEIKLRHLVPMVKEILSQGIHEVKVVDTHFIGTLDLLVPITTVDPTDDVCVYDLYDFKYSNNWMRYMESRQLHLYKYYLEKTTNKRIRNMYFVFVPKIQIRQKKTETIFDFRQRLIKELGKVQPKIEPIHYDPQKVIDHLELTQSIMQCQDYYRNPTNLCHWCDFRDLCEKGEMIMALPSTSRVAIDATTHKKLWIYGSPFSGKTTLCDSAPTPLNLNTDGNTKMVTMARLPIKDTMDGRQKVLAWDVFKGAIDDLEKGSDFETIVVDLLEDTYESCRLWMYKQMGITHESEDGFRAWDKVHLEFLSTFRRLLNLPYNIVLISHEDTSKDITKKGGDKVTAIKPNIKEKIANKIAGMVDIVCRVVIEDNGRFLSFKTDNVVFGGGRIVGHGKTQIPLTWDAIEEFYASVVGGEPKVVKPTPKAEPTPKVDEPTPTEDDLTASLREVVETIVDPVAESAEDAPKRRVRRTRD